MRLVVADTSPVRYLVARRGADTRVCPHGPGRPAEIYENPSEHVRHYDGGVAGTARSARHGEVETECLSDPERANEPMIVHAFPAMGLDSTRCCL
jgi:hypothetical protein